MYPEQRAEVAIAQERLTALRRTSRMNGAPAGAIAPGDVSSVTRPVFDSYCVSCHSAANRTAGLSLDALSRAPVGENLALWEKVTRRLQARRRSTKAAPHALTTPPIVSSSPGSNRRSTRRTQRTGRCFRSSPCPTPSWRRGSQRSSGMTPPMRSCSRPRDAAICAIPSELSRHVARMLRDPEVRQPGGPCLRRVALAGQVADEPSPTRRYTRNSTPTFVRRWRPRRGSFCRVSCARTAGRWSCGRRITRYVNDRLARHYGLSGVSGKEFVRVSWPNTNRAGLLGQAGPLTAVSQASRTSPTVRGVYRADALLRDRRAQSARQRAGACRAPGQSSGHPA